MTVVNPETGELLDHSAADRRAMKISLRLDSIAENFDRVMPMIREAIELRDDIALGYRSPGDYVSDRFGSALSRLPIELRRETVRELTEAGLSTRAIAPVVGVSHKTVFQDTQVLPPVTPESRPVAESPVTITVTPAVVGIDGKTYSASTVPAKAPKRRAITESFFDAAFQLTKITERIERLAQDDRFARNAEQVAATHRSDLTRSIEALSRVLDQLNNY